MNKKILRFVFLTLISISFWSFIGWSQSSEQDFPKPMDPPRLVNDFANVLSSSENEQLEKTLEAFNDSTSNEIAIVTLKSVGAYDIASYTFELGNKWGIGKKGKRNGVLILAAIDDRKIWIATGYGLEGALPDALVGRIIRNEILPFFRSGNYYQGFSNGIVQIIKASKDEYKADPNDNSSDVLSENWGPIMVLIVIFILIFFIASKTKGGGGNNTGGGRYISRRGSDIWLGGFGGGGSFGGGGGGGGFGGFGGGSFGGGGAGGSW
ncbi:MAG TPA: TPM domain-containing protein [Edaphocola sp.]|nr:TPM domain-containing protein [Edaphocola sp.]